jgi:hypothetical protein
MIMRHYFLITYLLYLILSLGCKKSVPVFNATATIIGPDLDAVACGSTIWIQIDGHPSETIIGYYNIGTLPAGFHLNNATYPIKVEIAYSIDPNCLIDVDISRIKVIN